LVGTTYLPNVVSKGKWRGLGPTFTLIFHSVSKHRSSPSGFYLELRTSCTSSGYPRLSALQACSLCRRLSSIAILAAHLARP